MSGSGGGGGSGSGRPGPLEWNAVLARSGAGGAASALAAASASTAASTGKPREVTMDEVRRHRSRGDAWMAVRGKAYDVTRYAEYHPGGVDEIMRAAGDDATALFDEYHKWVSVEGMLRTHLVGPVARPAAPPAWPSLDSWTKVKMLARRRVAADCHVVAFHGAPPARPWPATWYVKLRVSVSGRAVERPYTPLPRSMVPDALVDASLGLPEPLVLLVKEYDPRRVMSWCLCQAPLPEDVVRNGGSLQGEIQPRCPLELEPAPPWAGKKFVGLVCAGTGVTPMFQILEAALAAGEGQGPAGFDAEQRFWLVWANTSPAHVPLARELAALVARFQGRLAVLHVFSRPGSGEPDDAEALASLIEPATGALGASGAPSADPAAMRRWIRVRAGARIDRDTFFRSDPDALPPVGADACVVYCGTWAFEKLARAALLAHGYPTKSVSSVV